MTTPLTCRLITLLGAIVMLASCARGGDAERQFEIMAQYPHDSTAYTQGLLWKDGTLYESTGRYGVSTVRRVDLKSGKVLASRALPGTRFGEGLALFGTTLYQLTWQSGVAYTYEAATLTPSDTFTYAGEGWGLTSDSTSLIMSDGSDSLRFLDPRTFATRRVIHAAYQGGPVYKINELEFVGGEILANVYETNIVLRIDPSTGNVKEMLDFADLYPERSPTAEVMNGIATSPVPGELLVTGKLWPVMFRVRLKAPTSR